MIHAMGSVEAKGFRLTGDRVAIRVEEDIYKGRIIIPATAKKDPPMKGRVVAVGPGMLTRTGERWPMPVKVGELVIFHKNEGREVVINGEKLLLVRDDAILATYTNPQET